MHAQRSLARQHIALRRTHPVPPSLRNPPPCRRTLRDSRVVRATDDSLLGIDQLRRPEAVSQKPPTDPPKPPADESPRSRANLWRLDRAAPERGGWLIDGARRGMLEAQVGIRCWTDDLPGFSGILKQRYAFVALVMCATADAAFRSARYKCLHDFGRIAREGLCCTLGNGRV